MNAVFAIAVALAMFIVVLMAGAPIAVRWASHETFQVPPVSHDETVKVAAPLQRSGRCKQTTGT